MSMYKTYRIYALNNGRKMYLLGDLKSFSSSSYAEWEDEEKAKNVIKSMLKNKKNKKQNYYIEENEKKEKKQEKKSQEVRELMNSIISFQNDEKQNRESMMAAIKREEDAVMDILHFIEISDDETFEKNAETYAYQIRDHRKKRRECKDALRMMDTVSSFIPKNANFTAVNCLKSMDNRKYRPRYFQTFG